MKQCAEKVAVHVLFTSFLKLKFLRRERRSRPRPLCARTSYKKTPSSNLKVPINNTSETYIGLTENDFKARYRNHTASFRHTKHRNSTEISKHIWALKDSNIDYSISWRIISSSSPYNSSSKRCNLCLKEKFLIICMPT